MPKILISLVICLLVFASCRQEIDTFGIHFTLDQRKLGNGLTVILVEDPAASVVTYQTWFRVGSAYEMPGATGTTRLFEHLMFKGTTRYGPKMFLQELEVAGAEVNALATRDYTAFYETFVPELLEKVIDMEADRMSNLVLSEAGLNQERLIALEERRLKLETIPETKLHEALWELAYRRHSYQWPISGRISDLMRISLAQLKSFYQSYFQPANACVVVIGKFNANETFDLIKKYYGGLPSYPVPAQAIFEEPEQKEERRLVMREPVSSEQFALGYHITSAEDEDSFSLDVLSNILFVGSFARAYQRLVEKDASVLDLRGSAFTPAFPGLFTVTGVMKEGVSSEKAEKALDEVINAIQDQGVTQKEVDTAVSQLTLQLLDGVRTPQGLGHLLGTSHMILKNVEKFASDFNRYAKVTPQDVRRVAVKYLNPNNRSVVTLIPKKSEKL